MLVCSVAEPSLEIELTTSCLDGRSQVDSEGRSPASKINSSLLQKDRKKGTFTTH